MTYSQAMSVVISDAQNRHHRRSATKSRKGCLRCKTRRVRCDERKPECGNCLRYGRQCPGFQQQLKWSDKHELPNAPDAATERATMRANHSAYHGEQPSTSWEVLSNTSMQNPIHLPSLLVEYWFKNVCPMRSTFDSDVNYNRTIAHGTWTTSEPVFLTLQYMSAACLADTRSTIPSIQGILPSLAGQAIASVRGETQRIRRSAQGSDSEVTVDLLFAIFSLGTSVHWAGPVGYDIDWLGDARALLSSWTSAVTPIHAMVRAHFRQALTYWEMCSAASGKGSIYIEMRRCRLHCYSTARESKHLLETESQDYIIPSLPSPPSSDITPWSTRPNSWGGVSEEVIHYFGQVMALCSKIDIEEGHPDSRTPREIQLYCDTLIAQRLKMDLLSLDFNEIVLQEEAQGFLVGTEDSRTPLNHLTETAEAYRQAALLELYMAFEDLPISYTAAETEVEAREWTAAHGMMSRERLLRQKALDLIAILKRIPLESGAVTMHPRLYLSARTALGLTSAI